MSPCTLLLPMFSSPRNCLSRFFIRSSPTLSFALVPKLLSLRKRKFHFHFAVFEVHPGGNESQASLLSLANQFSEFLFMHEQFASTEWGVVENVSVIVRADMSIQ